MPRTRSVVSVARRVATADAKARAELAAVQNQPTADSLVNYQHKLGIGADNALTSSTYSYNPITRNRNLLEFQYRGTWIAGVAVDVIPDDMTKNGIEHQGEVDPKIIAALDEQIVHLGLNVGMNRTLKWSRLYGGALAVMLIDGQDHSTPLRVETIPKNAFKGLLVLDRWMVEPSLNDLVQELGPSLGLPKFYRVTANAPALVGQNVHYTRVVRFEGVTLPYYQRLQENMWGLSVLERLYDRLVMFDSATTGAAQLVYKAHQRTFKVKGLRAIVAAGGKILDNFTNYVDVMRRWQGIEGMSTIDADDELDTTSSNTAFSGLADAIGVFGEQLSGALQIPLVRLFGQSPKGFSTGDADLQTYEDGIHHRQETELRVPWTTLMRVLARSLGKVLPEGYQVGFKPLRQMTHKDKADVAKTITEAVIQARDAGLTSDQVALKDLKQQSAITGVHSNITDEDIARADDVPAPPIDEGAGPGDEGTPPGEKTPLRAVK